MDEYLISMAQESKMLTFFLIGIMLILSYRYVIDEVDATAAADPTHSGKALLSTLMPYLWLLFIIVTLVAAILAAFDML